jgi:Holliday junction resolvase RusA-like endonuclease
VTFQARVGGPPVSYGSKKALLHRTTGRVVMMETNAATVRGWQDAMRLSMRADCPATPLLCPVRLAINIFMRRPKGHFRVGLALTKAGLASPFPTRKPDGDKVARAVADCGTGIWYHDDAQVVEWTIKKLWTESEERTEVWMAVAVPRD